jgi:hypothetical protein
VDGIARGLHSVFFYKERQVAVFVVLHHIEGYIPVYLIVKIVIPHHILSPAFNKYIVSYMQTVFDRQPCIGYIIQRAAGSGRGEGDVK